MKKYKISVCGDAALTVEFEGGISPGANLCVSRLSAMIAEKRLKGVYATLPAYRSLTVCYSPLGIKQKKLKKILKKLCKRLGKQKDGTVSSRLFCIPVAYGGEFGPDMDSVSRHAKLAPDDVIRLHTEPEYLVYMLGFLPGFAYLGGLDPRLFTPRLDSPRTKIPEGSVGIGGEQTGIYPIASPGGWRLIGRTPIRLYDPEGDTPVLLSAGDRIKFYAITPEEFSEIKAQISRGEYKLMCEEGHV